MNVVILHASLHTKIVFLLTFSYFSACMYLVCFLAFLTIHEFHSHTFRLKGKSWMHDKMFQNMKE